MKTASTFLREGRLLSRGSLEERGFTQTYQVSDSKDKRYGLWYDLFLDDVDIHYRTKKENSYGPVLFAIDVNVLAEDWFASLWITKENPLSWNDSLTHQQKYFSTEREVISGYTIGTFKQMLVFRHIGGVLRLGTHLKEIIVDDPRVEIGGNYVHTESISILESASKKGGNIYPIRKRDCCPNCRCYRQLGAMRSDLVENYVVRSFVQ